MNKRAEQAFLPVQHVDHRLQRHAELTGHGEGFDQHHHHRMHDRVVDDLHAHSGSYRAKLKDAVGQKVEHRTCLVDRRCRSTEEERDLGRRHAGDTARDRRIHERDIVLSAEIMTVKGGLRRDRTGFDHNVGAMAGFEDGFNRGDRCIRFRQ